jgi:very-short-patch-repair endonuclease
LYHKRTAPKIFHQAQQNRHEPAPAESRLWDALRAHRFAGIHFRRQHSIGHYIVDFYAPAHKLIIEVDGNQHLGQKEYDQERTAYLAGKGYRVLRFWNGDVLNKITDVMSAVQAELEISDIGKGNR